MLTQVTPAKGVQVMQTLGTDLPIIHPPIVLPAPAPGKDRTLQNYGIKSRLAYYRKLVDQHGWKGARPWILSEVRGNFAHRWFIFKIKHGLIQDSRTWLFK